MQPRYLTQYYPEAKFGGYSDIDGTVVFYTRVRALISRASIVVDFGCGRGAYIDDEVALRSDLRNFKGKAGNVIGLDVDAAGASNTGIDEFFLLNGDNWPLKDSSVDLCICDSVLEHLPAPEKFFSEARRVLRPYGYICIRTPNLLSYVGLASYLIPNRLHSRVLSKVQDGRKEEDVFPTYYRCNSIWKLRKSLAQAGFDEVVYGYEAEPGYLSFSEVAYWLGTVHHRLVPRIFAPAIFGFGKLRK